ncbi:hypothetical protein CURE108131_10945 [Cupriavidus respiraculi]|uniref:Uncharacterized protein n=1 Tax=Cupriavidus respiraculi TaxID=195930 RepID=A0ABN7YIZ2_9BURK|nr:hypothetical protein LMG21510_01932 [Cupriavidus respiraculi]
MLQLKNWRARAATPAMLALLLIGCATESPSWSPPVEPARIPALPAQARQPAVPSECLPTCSSALTVERGSWLNMLTGPESPAKLASAPTTP